MTIRILARQVGRDLPFLEKRRGSKGVQDPASSQGVSVGTKDALLRISHPGAGEIIPQGQPALRLCLCVLLTHVAPDRSASRKTSPNCVLQRGASVLEDLEVNVLLFLKRCSF